MGYVTIYRDHINYPAQPVINVDIARADVIKMPPNTANIAFDVPSRFPITMKYPAATIPNIITVGPIVDINQLDADSNPSENLSFANITC